MTRTERNIYPAALAKDRHLSKSGLDKSLRKNGAGAHNWGSFEEQAHPYVHHTFDDAKLPPPSQPSKVGEEDVDLGNDGAAQDDQLAASPSAAAAINIDGGGEQAEKGVPNGGMQRRMSNMTDEEREKAKAWRHGALNRDSLDLASIARTSGAFSQSPPNADSILSTSPVMNMSAMAGKLNKY
ncbi:hypothetical protein QFC22_003033 [Naganishia vaughanmartiniae]|uniref:Uncharacterized protein n=1 Tax=Naganishia vaughanmartiniae TaxID=1424756 RepID=A0ACC2X9S3_9TREE|nr:hypothetical protein QFC22_003033 [Naganishia vaughanmartiniae]